MAHITIPDAVSKTTFDMGYTISHLNCQTEEAQNVANW